MLEKQKITPHLWFDDNAEEAANFYVSVFENARILDIGRYTDVGPGTPGSVVTVAFELEGQKFVGINGGPHFKFNEAVSFFVSCDTQEEIDRFWDALTPGGEIQQCGWLKDKFGLAWQINYSGLSDLIQDSNREKASRAMQAMLQMKKIDIGELRAAYDGQ
ncbi:VOC family protein [Chelativorans sp. YIM 93263]|uniref:VOC family protein n=1 Tax=Chelativorans sp. YIM 93263 TaxID=2906648 RepID=UPI0023787BAB|nr:VOC family protein [Chelativorans sp. YIM 93263]